MRAVIAPLLIAALGARVGDGIIVRLRLVLFPTEAFILWKGVLVNHIAFWTAPVEEYPLVERIQIPNPFVNAI